MNTTSTLQTNTLEPKELNYSFFRKKGIELLEQLTDANWSDFNAHDPGITILEQLCYALWDLSYRNTHAIQDIIRQPQRGNAPGTYKPMEILPTGPVTAVDLRKILIDLTGVNNAWVDPFDQSKLRFEAVGSELSMTDSTLSTGSTPGVTSLALQGLLKVLVEQSYIVNLTSFKVAKQLNNCRGLCQDFQTPRILDRQMVRILAKIEITEVKEDTELLARIYKCIADYMSPPVPFYSLEDLQTKKSRRIDQAFEGPKLIHGFIDSDELTRLQRRKILYASDLIHRLTQIDGVAVVKSLAFQSGSEASTNQWSFSVDDGYAVSFETPSPTATAIDIQLERNGIPIVNGALQAKAVRRFGVLRQQSVSPDLNADIERLLAPPESEERNLSAYPSILREFPATYGVGEGVLPESAPPERKALAKQLKAYLMFFDQLLANQMAQLGNAGKLLSFDDDSTISYFSQVVAEDDEGLKMDELRRFDPDAHREWLDKNTEDPSPFSATAFGEIRRNRFLDHLLARFGRQSHYSEALASRAVDDTTSLSRQISSKRSLLADYVQIGHDRGLGFDYLEDPGPDNMSGLERVLRHTFGLGLGQHAEQFFVVEHILLRPIASDQAAEPFLRNARSADPYSLQFTLVFPDCQRYENRNLIEKIVRDETPIHLRPHFLWLAEDAMETFITAHSSWLEKWRDYRNTLFKNELASEDKTIPLRNARNELIDLLGIGITYALSDLNVSTNSSEIASGSTAEISIEHAQNGVTYALCDSSGNPVIDSAGVEIKGTGYGSTLTIETPQLSGDVTYQIEIFKQSPLSKRRFLDTTVSFIVT